MPPYYQSGQVTLWHGDCAAVMQALPDVSIDAVVTDPPYGLDFMGNDWDNPARMVGQGNSVGNWKLRKGDPGYVSGNQGWYGHVDMRKFQTWCEAWARECIRLLKPGGHLLAFGGTRTFHRLAAGIEDAGFEIRDSIAWLYGSGFPKSKNLDGDWQGWGTALKPAFEPIVVARKPLVGTVAANVLAHGTGALNIDASRIAHRNAADLAESEGKNQHAGYANPGSNRDSYSGSMPPRQDYSGTAGRWPANVILDESQAAALDEQSGWQRDGVAVQRNGGGQTIFGGIAGAKSTAGARADAGYGAVGGASRFFYTAKAAASERPSADGVQHPTVKPLALMQWLVRLVTPVGGTVLEPFAGSGTSVEACVREGMRCIAIEREATYLPLIMQRIDKPHPVGLDFDWEAS